MKKQFSVLFPIISVIVALVSIATAQKTADKIQPLQSEFDVLQTYKEISALPFDANMRERRAVFLKLSSQEKSELFKLHLAMQLVKRPNLAKEQKDLILDSISMITPESYGDDPEKRVAAQQKAAPIQQKALLLFSSKREAAEIFAALGGDEADVQLLGKYQQITAPIYQNERRASFSKSSSQDKADVMKIHLASQMAKRPLNKEQLNFISGFISLISPEIYVETKSAQIKEALASFRERVLNFFSKEDAFVIFASLGGKIGSPNTEAHEPKLLNLLQKEDAFVVFASFGREIGISKKSTINPEPCGCNSTPSQDYCSWWEMNTYCRGGFCASSTWGCGDGLLEECNGVCRSRT
ncbi:MAG TPA: bacteriocin fulvocin C-related protein [Pyrinomonadaceae bacterium]|jgi:hypothetical protein